jgi:U3 small nucleolar RNA-associated protein 14
MGGLADDNEDSDLDSDEAFGASDEERFENFTFRGSSKSKKGKKKAAPKKDLDLDEDDESEFDNGDSEDDVGEGFGDDGVDLATMLDDDDEEVLGGKDTTKKDMGEDSGSEEDDEDNEDSESESEDDDDDSEAGDEERAARMRDRLEALDKSSRSAKSATAEAFAMPGFDDFDVDTAQAQEATSSKSKKKAAKMGPIAAPLPKRQQDRIDREIATQKAKEQLDRWKDTVTRNRRAEFLSFPLQDPNDQSGTVGKEKFTPASQQVPHSELEESIQRIMEESGLAAKHGQAQEGDVGDEEQALLKSEELATNKLPIEEVMRRRAELRKARELLFREEIKAKRISKIKSKSYRRVHRKERERMAEQERLALEGMGVDPMDEDDKERQDRKRAEARMGTKHKDSKWAKSLKATGKAVWDEDARDGVMEQARRNEELMKRMAGRDVSDDEGSDFHTGDDDSGDDDDDTATLKKLDGLKSDAGQTKGLAGMKFMRAADERRQKANNEDVERLRKALAIQDGEEADSEEEEQSLGRAIFGPASKQTVKEAPKEQRLEFEAPEGSDNESDDADDQEAKIVTENKDKAGSTPHPKKMTASGPLASSWLKEIDEDSNKSKGGWLQAPKGKSKKARGNVEVEMDLDIAASTRPAKSTSTTDDKPVAKEGTAADTSGWTTVTYKGDASDDNSDDEPSNPVLTAAQQKQSLQQRAFAGDDVQAAFDAEKEALIASEDEKEVSTHLPGWGNWAGDGLSKSIKKANARAKHNPLFKTKLPGGGVKAEDRKDRNMDKVIVSEKSERKGKKYLAPVLPHVFETKEQYERANRVPIGPEWTTKVTHQRMTRPRVVVKKGVNVQALERPVA